MQTIPVLVALACYAPGVAAQISASLSTVFSIPATVIASSVSTATLISSTTSTLTPSPSFSFPPPGSIPRDYSPNGLEELWDIVGLFHPIENPSSYSPSCRSGQSKRHRLPPRGFHQPQSRYRLLRPLYIRPSTRQSPKTYSQT